MACSFISIIAFTYAINSSNSISVRLEAAVPLGLILNEIVSNFFKHACQNRTDASFTFDLEIQENELIIQYSDNGIGFEEHNEDETYGSLGMELIRNLTDQLDGEFDYFNKNGANYNIKIPTPRFN